MKKSKARNVWELFLTFFKIGLFTFGGGYAMISLMERETVENKKWVTSEDILDMISIAESTPGVMAVNSATFIGYKIAGVLGSLCATIGAVLPSVIVITIIGYFGELLKNNYWINAAFRGIRACVVVLILNAVVKIVKPMEKTWLTLTVAVIAFALVTLLNVNAVWLILFGLVFGVVYRGFFCKKKAAAAETSSPSAEESSPEGPTGQSEAEPRQEAGSCSAFGTEEAGTCSGENAPGNASSETEGGKRE